MGLVMSLLGGFSFGFWWLGFVLIWWLGMVLGDRWFVVVVGYGFAGFCFKFGSWVWCWVINGLLWWLGMGMVLVARYGFAGVCFEFGSWVWCWGWVPMLMMAGWWQR